MDLAFDELRSSDSSFIAHVWRSHSEAAGQFISMADIHCGIVVSNLSGKLWVTFRGPETAWSPAVVLQDAEWLGIVLRPGVYLSVMPPAWVMDRRDLTFPGSRRRGFAFAGMSVEVPGFSNAEDLVRRLFREGLLSYDPLVAAVLQKRTVDMSERNTQRRFRHATGLVPTTALQIERARRAARLLKNGRSVTDVAFTVGYYDQPHMTRSFKRFIGVSPARLPSQDRIESLSFLYEE
jgi:AraC-like DNA-binding protein